MIFRIGQVFLVSFLALLLPSIDHGPAPLQWREGYRYLNGGITKPNWKRLPTTDDALVMVDQNSLKMRSAGIVLAHAYAVDGELFNSDNLISVGTRCGGLYEVITSLPRPLSSPIADQLIEHVCKIASDQR